MIKKIDLEQQMIERFRLHHWNKKIRFNFKVIRPKDYLCCSQQFSIQFIIKYIQNLWLII